MEVLELVPTAIEVATAKRILKAKAAHRAKFIGHYMRLIELLEKSEYTVALRISAKGDDLTVELMDATCHTFSLYDFNEPKDLREGFALMRQFMLKGIPIPYHSMTDIRLDEQLAKIYGNASESH